MARYFSNDKYENHVYQLKQCAHVRAPLPITLIDIFPKYDSK